MRARGVRARQRKINNRIRKTQMKVLKFGGTSVGTVYSLQHVKSIVEGCDEQVVVVVSALGGITDKLINTAQLASQGDAEYLQQFKEIVRRHEDVIVGMVPAEKELEVRGIVEPLLEELGNIFRGISLIKDLSDRTRDIVVSYGERLSSAIIARIIDGAVHFDSRKYVTVSYTHLRAHET